MPRTRLALSVYYFAFFTVMGVYFPFMPAWFQQRGLSGLEIGALSALLPTMSVLAPPAFGMLADALGLRGALIRVAALGGLLSLAAFSVVSAWSAPSFWPLFCCALAFTFFRTPMSQIADVVAMEHPGDYGRVRLWGSLGFLVSALAIGRWVPLEPAWVLPAIGAAGMVGAWVASWPLPTRSAMPGLPVLAEVRRLLQQREFRWFLGSAALGQAAHAAYDWSLSLHLRDLGASGSTIGLAWAIATGGEVVLLLFSKRLLARWSLATSLCVALGASVVRWILLANVSDVSVILLIQPMHALTFAVRWVCCLQIVGRYAAPQALATAQGVFLGIFSFGSALGMLLSGVLYDLGRGWLVFTSALLAGLALLVTLALRGHAALR